MKVNFYLELEWKSQPVTDFKELTIIHHNIQKNNIIFVWINCLTHIYNTVFLNFLAAYSLIASSYDDFVISFFLERTETWLSQFFSMVDHNLFFVIDSAEKLLSASQLILVMSYKFLGLLSSQGNPLSSFFRVWAVGFRGISRALLGPLPGPWKGRVQVRQPEA